MLPMQGLVFEYLASRRTFRVSDIYRFIENLMSIVHRPSRFAVILAFGLVYFFWGSTYLAIDIAVERIPPALMCGLRFLIAGVCMLAFCGLRGRRIRYNARQLGEMATGG